MDVECLKTTFNESARTHDAPPCVCTEHGLPTGAAGENASKWITSAVSQKFVGAMPVYSPYFYYQLPHDRYPGTSHIGFNYATPKAGKCEEGRPLPGRPSPLDAPAVKNVAPVAPVLDDACAWRRLPGARVVYGSEFLANGWNDTVVIHWPLHTFGPDTQEQLLHNIPIFNSTFAALSTTPGLLTPRCCGC